MRLRQICLVARELDPAACALCDVFAIEVAYRDPEVGIWGLHNIVAPVGGDFLEIVSPKEEGTSAGRYLDRRGGDGGYMTILNCDDALAARARVAARGVRDIYRIDRPGYIATQFHPRDCGGVLLTMDSVPGVADCRERLADWPPAGEDWRAHVATSRVAGFAGVTIQAEDAEATATLWSDLVERPLRRDGGAFALHLDNAFVRFVPVADDRGPGISSVALAATDPAAILAAAEERGLAVSECRITVVGTVFELIQAASPAAAKAPRVA